MLNVEQFKLDPPATAIHPPATQHDPDVLYYGWRDYGVRAGIWRLTDVFDAHDVPVTAAVNAEVCDHYPEIVTAGLDRDREFTGHGTTNAKPHVDLAEEDERALIEASRDRLAEATGRRPRGWLGPELAETYTTPDLLAEAGFQYVCDWCNDDQPSPMRVRSGELLAMPYTLEVGDIPMFLTYGLSGPEFERALVDQFEVLAAEGDREGNAKVMCLSLHPFPTGHPFRSRYLDAALAHITAHEDVWLATGAEIAAHYAANYPTTPS